MTVYGVFQPPIALELKTPKITLGDLLSELANRCPTIGFFKKYKLGRHVETILLNDKVHYHLETNLNDGDKVMVLFEIEPMGGG